MTPRKPKAGKKDPDLQGIIDKAVGSALGAAMGVRRDETARQDDAVTNLTRKVDTIQTILAGNGTLSERGLVGEVRDIRKVLVGDPAEPDNKGICERMRDAEEFIKSWDRVKWLVVAATVTTLVAMVYSAVARQPLP
jgi:hypothetical protein